MSSIGLAGYYSGHAIGTVIGEIRQYELEVMEGIIAVAVLLRVVLIYHGRHRSAGNTT